ncbi:MAG TPA: hypothetical protein VH229_11780, partial [Candidatus Udaeobacter sp.]|nr:hypothetical protein [Candidatus Udaeobacter sp.]
YVAYHGDLKGIYTSRLNFFGFGAGKHAPDSAEAEFSVSPPTLVVQTGDTINSFGPITDLNLYDSLNNRDRGDVAFWAKAGSSEAIIRARSQEVVYLDFDPTSDFRLDDYLEALFKEEALRQNLWVFESKKRPP